MFSATLAAGTPRGTALPRRIVLADLLPDERVWAGALIVAGAVLTGVSAQLSFPIPGSPVPVTGQTFAVLLTGAALGWRRGCASMSLYLVAGGLGVPWFSGHSSGFGSVTVGYLIGFVVASAVVGRLAERGGDKTPMRTIGSMTAGTLIIYAVGLPYLAYTAHVGLAKAFDLGAQPFLAGDALKVVAAAGLLPGVWRVLGHRRQNSESSR